MVASRSGTGRAVSDSDEAHPVTARILRAWARTVLDDSGVKHTPKEIDWMIMEAAQCSMLSLITEPDRELSAKEAGMFSQFIHRRASGEPVQYILGTTEFYALSIRVNSSVLIPRPETEGLVDRALEYIRKNPETHVLDVGTGSGCIAIALAVQCTDLRISAIDNSPDALLVAKSNGKNHGVEIAWHLADYNDPRMFDSLGGPFGLIVSNPPYVTAGEFANLEPVVRNYEPKRALTPGEDSTGPYRQLATLAHGQLVPGGLLLVEINEKLGREVCRILSEHGLKEVEIQTDLAGRDRYVIARKQ